MDPRLEQVVHAVVERLAIFEVDAARHGRRVDDRDAHHLHVGGRRLQGEEGGVEPGQVLHLCSSRPGIQEMLRPRETERRMLPWVFLILAVWGAVLVLVSFLPPRKPALLMGIGFFAAWTTTEMAPLYVLGFIGFITVLILFGALSAWPGWLALAIAIGSLFWLLTSVRGALRTNRVFLDALREDLGPNWDANLDPALEEAGRHVSWGRVLLPFWFRRRGVQRVRNIQYVDDGSRRHRLDIYRCKAKREAMPVLLQIHGGGWMISNK